MTHGGGFRTGDSSLAGGKRRLWSAPIKGLCLFALLGPPLGAILWVALIVATDTVQGRGSSVAEIVPGGLLFFVFSYLFGVVPAAITGLVAGLLRRAGRLRRVRDCVGLALLASLIATVYGVVQQFGGAGLGSAFLMFGLPGFASGFCCGLLFRAEPAPRVVLD